MKNPPANETAHGMAASRTPRIRDLVIYFLRLGTFGFGGPVALCGLMEKELFTFFFKAGSLTFGSGLVIVPFLEKGLVQQTGWLNGREFFVAVAVGMLSPGPVVITATFVGYLVAGFWGSLIATVGIFLPCWSG
jgi:chromate transport protein ChrA